MRVCLIHSNQPFNQYAGGSTGQSDSEQWWMAKLTHQMADHLRPHLDLEVGPLGASYADNVTFVNQRHAIDPFNLLLSNHSNAGGDSMILWGTSQASRLWADRFRLALNKAAIVPPGDTWTLYDRKVAEVKNTAPPAVLLEWHRHDTLAGAQWLREQITSGQLARNAAQVVLDVLDVPTAAPLAVPRPAVPSLERRTLSLRTPMMRGEDVRKLQRFALSVFPSYAHGIRARGGADGWYGKATRDWVREFQRRAGLSADGIVGDRTWAALERYGFR